MRRTRTAKAKIAEYWASAEGHARLPENAAAIDWGEPMCFACGRCATAPDEPPELWQVWNRAMLERCHLVPASLGGADETANLVLLCASCHHDAPDVADSGYMLRWIARREPWGARISSLTEDALADLDLTGVPVEACDLAAMMAHADELRRDWTALHGRAVSDATMVALFVEAFRRMLTAKGFTVSGDPPAARRGSR